MTKAARRFVAFVTLALLVTAGVACSGAHPATGPSAPTPAADRTDQYFPYLQGKRVALVANPSSLIHGQPSLDAFLASQIRVFKCFGPEHGFRGNASNGTTVGDEVDAKTGIPILSLYGKRRQPTREDLADVDVVIYDIQDMGVRFYTNINVLRNVMDACAQNGKELLILDRPNPHAYMVDGPILDMKLKSGIGQFPIPIAHGMTTGEFAQMINGEHWLPENRQCRLKIIPVANYTHDTPYTLPVPPSPNLNTQQGVMLYPSTCLFEGTILNHGRGTYTPFCVLGAPALKGKYEFSYTPHSIPGMSENPVHKDQVCYGLDLRNYDTEQLRKRRQINVQWMIDLYNAYPDKAHFFDHTQHPQIGNIDKLAGTTEFQQQIKSGWTEQQIRATWQPGLEAFKKTRAKYLIYP
jgi:uncharacterized protein YbbC (DUF1343 family)